MDSYFGYHDCNFETFETEQEAIDWCKNWLDEERGEPWSDESLNICYGKITGGTKITREVDCDGMSYEEMEEHEINLPSDCTIYQEREILPFETESSST